MTNGWLMEEACNAGVAPLLICKTILVTRNRWFEQLTFNDYSLLDGSSVPVLAVDCSVVDDTTMNPCSDEYIVSNLQVFGEWVWVRHACAVDPFCRTWVSFIHNETV